MFHKYSFNLLNTAALNYNELYVLFPRRLIILQYYSSDLEVEIRTGMQFSNEQTCNCLAFIRKIVDLKNYVNHPTAAKFMELVFDEEENKFRIDTEADLRLTQLREEAMQRWLPSECISNFSVLWKQNDGINVELHKDHLEQVCVAFEEKMRESVDRLAPEIVEDTLTNLELEVYQHWSVAKEHYATFVGRGELLSIIKSYVMSNDCKLLVLHGDSGVGKTAIVAKSAVEVGQLFAVIPLFLESTKAYFKLQYLARAFL
jgi:flagellar biosynthesis GTPase FlhF